MELLLIACALCVVYWNGANDNFKGFATVWGSRTLGYRQALILASLATAAGSLASWWLAGSLVQSFSGRGLVPDAVANAPHFLASVGAGAALTLIAATRLGLPVSTTHALVGGLAGAGAVFAPAQIAYRQLLDLFLLPLLLSPLLAASLAWLATRLNRPVPESDCACVIAPAPMLTPEGVTMKASGPVLLVAASTECAQQPGVTTGFSLSALATRTHVLSAALICFARGVNDTPKLAALLLAAQLVDAAGAGLAIALVMTAGGLLHSRRVAVTMSERVTPLTHARGLAANLITATLVLFASKFGYAVSTTHVSVGAIAGVGAGDGNVDWSVTRSIVLSWLATLPLAAALAWLAATGLST